MADNINARQIDFVRLTNMKLLQKKEGATEKSKPRTVQNLVPSHVTVVMVQQLRCLFKSRLDSKRVPNMNPSFDVTLSAFEKSTPEDFPPI